MSDREGEIFYDISYMWNLKRKDTKEHTRLVDFENKLIAARGKDGRRGS